MNPPLGLGPDAPEGATTFHTSRRADRFIPERSKLPVQPTRREGVGQARIVGAQYCRLIAVAGSATPLAGGRLALAPAGCIADPPTGRERAMIPPHAELSRVLVGFGGAESKGDPSDESG
jgi:hypothetical protein